MALTLSPLALRRLKRTLVAAHAVTPVALVLLASSGCQPTGRRPPVDCSHGCLCVSVADCSDGWECTLGFCTLTGCEAGSEGCACGVGGECTQSGSASLACLSNVCQAQAAPAPGTLGGACGTCAGDGLVCVSGVCERLGCPSGELGCPCGPYGACAMVAGREARCHEGRCETAGCLDGALGCRCDARHPCAPALSCLEGLCRAPAQHLHVANTEVRACDVLFDPVLPTSGVRFGAEVRGELLHRAPRLGASFVVARDGGLTGAALSIEGAGAVQIAKAACFNRLGERVASPGLALRER